MPPAKSNKSRACFCEKTAVMNVCDFHECPPHSFVMCLHSVAYHKIQGKNRGKSKGSVRKYADRAKDKIL